jgi:hypothetical protein
MMRHASNTPIYTTLETRSLSQMNRVGPVYVRRVGRLNFEYAPWSWYFANRQRREIDAFFSDECKENPSF